MEKKFKIMKYLILILFLSLFACDNQKEENEKNLESKKAMSYDFSYLVDDSLSSELLQKVYHHEGYALLDVLKQIGSFEGNDTLLKFDADGRALHIMNVQNEEQKIRWQKYLSDLVEKDRTKLKDAVNEVIKIKGAAPSESERSFD